jgi:hypothetical protein
MEHDVLLRPSLTRALTTRPTAWNMDVLGSKQEAVTVVPEMKHVGSHPEHHWVLVTVVNKNGFSTAIFEEFEERQLVKCDI